MRTCFIAAVFLMASTNEPALELTPALKTLLDTGQWSETPPGFRIITLSQLADGCAQQARAQPSLLREGRGCVLRAEQLALSLGPKDLALANGLYLTHLNLILGAEDQVSGCQKPALHRHVSELLAARSLADPLAHASSYPSLSLRWPADQAATLASLARADLAHDTTLLAEPLRRWKSVMQTKLDTTRALPWSEVTGKGPGARLPRGCAQSYISRYLAEVDPELAKAWWHQYQAFFLVRPGPLVGFREWPRGVERGADSDSGPIIMGIGAAASAFGLAAARAQGDLLLAAQLEASEDLVLATGAGGGAAHSTLAEAIRYESHWQATLVSAAPAGSDVAVRK